MKLRVDNQPNGSALVRGKVWKAGESGARCLDHREDRHDPPPRGQPRLYGDGISEVYFDNFKVYKNQ